MPPPQDAGMTKGTEQLVAEDHFPALGSGIAVHLTLLKTF